MKPERTPSFISELELSVSAKDIALPEKNLRIARSIYNACLNESLKRLRALRGDKDYRDCVSEYVRSRAIDRSLRATNPDNYNENGTIKKGSKEWACSGNLRRLESI
jgi:hypothetical protein